MIFMGYVSFREDNSELFSLQNGAKWREIDPFRIWSIFRAYLAWGEVVVLGRVIEITWTLTTHWFTVDSEG